jgi:mono/diheme cytochrome c family protein
MYVVDMHRGIMQHRAYATPYYRNGIAHKELDTLLNAGRILRIKSKSKNPVEIPDLYKASGPQLVTLLKSDNGWIRDRAQQLLIYKQDKSVIRELQALAEDTKNAIPAIHALHTLDGLNGLSFEFLQKIASSENSMLSAHALLLLENYATKDYVNAMQELAVNLMTRNDTVVNLYQAISLGSWMKVSQETFMPLLAKLSRAYSVNPVFQEAIVSSLKGMEGEFKALISEPNNNKEQDKVIDSLLAQAIKNRQEKKMNSIFVDVSVKVDKVTSGLIIFRSTCMACHGADGEGIVNVAPPLKGSQYVEGSSERLAMIILNGLEGPLNIEGKSYKFNGSMPNFGNNFNDQEIADVITYLHNSFVPVPPKSVSTEKIKDLRSKHSGTLTQVDLLKMTNLKD